MTKSDLADRVAELARITKSEAHTAVDALLESIQEALAQGDRVQLVGFGSFEVRSRSARTGRNPQTGEPISIGPSHLPVFRPGRALKDAVQAR
ncbi:HU family DNA-binding protein [Limnochorda pilosa]|uniref:DNA-binding protein n=1 Tax=Limnochorda pilosa TaxID=1555112 RepID=A0A0K2SKH9_LIMPI|nr:HU family DNA-binding protein [Limnochorda pilosa]BAS27618.1 DNA-binding protein [Limnochorda pilosa]